MTLSLRIARVVDETEGIRSFELRHHHGGALPAFTAGAHISVRLGNGLVRQYSLASDPFDRERYLVGVLREGRSRGGSAFIFDHWKAGGRIEAETPANHFPLALDARRHLLIAGGIGITPLLAMAQTLRRRAADYTLYYCTRSPKETAFRDLLSRSGHGERVRFVHDGGDPRLGLDLGTLLGQHAAGSHVYVCGPGGLIEGVRTAAAHWPAECVHFEYFVADAGRPGPNTDRKSVV